MVLDAGVSTIVSYRAYRAISGTFVWEIGQWQPLQRNLASQGMLMLSHGHVGYPLQAGHPVTEGLQAPEAGTARQKPFGHVAW